MFSKSTSINWAVYWTMERYIPSFTCMSPIQK